MIGGTLDEFRINGELVCWSRSVVKGDTMRAMWFYQHKTAREKKMNLWYLALILSLCRVGNMEGVNYLDSGPSYNEDSKVAKEVRMVEESIEGGVLVFRREHQCNQVWPNPFASLLRAEDGLRFDL